MLAPAFRLLSPPGAGARLSILIFHRVLAERDPLFPDEPDARRFDTILGWLGRWCRVLPLDEAVRRLTDGTLPARAAAITFDDGYADNATQALPLLRRHGLSATFFVSTGFLDGGRMWNDTLIESVRRARAGTHDLAPLGIGIGEEAIDDIASRRRLIDRLLAGIKHLEPAARASAVETTRSILAADLGEPPMMTSAQVRALRDAGMPIGAHTCTHPILARLPDAAARDEIVAGRTALERLLDAPVTLFAYPNGKPDGDYRDRHVAMVREAGYRAAVSTAPGVSTAASDPFQLPRFSPWDRSRLRYGARLLMNLRRPDSAVASPG